MLGGGQLGRFFVGAAQELGFGVWVLDPDPDSPAGRIAERHLATGFVDPPALDELSRGCAAVSTEFENVPARVLDRLAASVRVHPAAEAVAVCQDRLAEKRFLEAHGLPHGPSMAVHAVEDPRDADPGLFPGILKSARFGYDGKGQAAVADPSAAADAFVAFERRPCVLERALALTCEVSVVLARGSDGEVRCFEPVENRHVGGVLDTSTVPAPISARLAAEAEGLAVRTAGELGFVGTLGVELFVCGDELLVNEIAPRPHNSGHHTLDACVTDQFEQQVRALCGLPLGEPVAHSAAVMVNLLGDRWFDGDEPCEPDWRALLATPNLKLHLYGKRQPRPGRKMGHFTVIGDDLTAVQRAAEEARASIGGRSSL